MGAEAGDLLRDMAALLAGWQENAALLDAERNFPVTELRQMRGIGAWLAPLPVRFGGFGMGTEPGGAVDLVALLRLVGRGNLCVGRIFEGHVNALKLIALYGTEHQLHRAAQDAAAGHLFAIWNTEPPEGLRMGAAVLRGRKTCCSAAGHATRALVTARTSDGEARMLLLPLDPSERMTPDGWHMQGMRACHTGTMDFDGMRVPDGAMIGEPGDYLRQPEFSAGAWRTSAVTLGGLEALVDEARRQLVGRQRDGDLHQQTRIGEALIAQETAFLWVSKAARIAEGRQAAADDVAAYVNLARIAVEACCLDAMRVVQRSLGLAGFLSSNPVERLLRDLATYLRQPAPDATLDEAAAWFMRRDLPYV